MTARTLTQPTSLLGTAYVCIVTEIPLSHHALTDDGAFRGVIVDVVALDANEPTARRASEAWARANTYIDAARNVFRECRVVTAEVRK